jgi:hypothetical protein
MKLAKECNARQLCNVFIWNLVNKTCHLFETLSHLTIIEDPVSIIGPRNCSIVEDVWPEFRSTFARKETNTETRYTRIMP